MLYSIFVLGMITAAVAGTVETLFAGWELVGAQRDPTDGQGYGVFSYVQPPSGLIVELGALSLLSPMT